MNAPGLARASLLGLLLGACVPPPPPVAHAPASPPDVAPPTLDDARPDPARLAADAGYLASLGAADRRAAADFVALGLLEAGLAPAAVAGDPGLPRALRRTRVVDGTRAGTPLVEVGAGADRRALEAVVAQGSAAGEVRGALVAVGHGVTAPAAGWDDYRGADVAGAIVVVVDGAPVGARGAERSERAPAVAALDDVRQPWGAPRARGPSARATAPAGEVLDPWRRAADAREPTRPGARPAPASGGEVVNPWVAPSPSPSPPPRAAKTKAAGVYDDDPRAEALREQASTRAKIRAARAAGAAGIVLVADGEALPTPPATADAEGLPAVVVRRSVGAALLAGARPAARRHAGAAAAHEADVAATLSTAIVERLVDAFEVTAALPPRPTSPPSPAPPEWVIVAARLDRGAADAGAGAAALLDAARRLAALPVRPARGVLFVGVVGDDALDAGRVAARASVPAASIDGVVLVDAGPRAGAPRLLVEGASSAAAWPELARAAGRDVALDLALGGAPAAPPSVRVRPALPDPAAAAELAIVTARLALGAAERAPRLAP